MAETSVAVTPGSGANVDVFSLPDGKVQEAVVIGDGTNQGRIVAVSAANALSVATPFASTSALTTVTVSTTSATVVSAQATRLGCAIFNDTTALLYLALSAVAATTSAHTVQVPVSGYYEVPFSYTGAVTAILAAGSTSGPVRVTVLTA